MKRGSFITEGPQDWQILQQKDGYADIHLGGYAIPETDSRALRVNAHVFHADDNRQIGPKVTAQLDSELKWSLTLEKVPAGGLYLIRTEVWCVNANGDEFPLQGEMRHQIGVGDVYVIAGQSNSAGFGRGTAADAPEIGVHILRNNGRWDIASHPLNDPTDTIHEENREGGWVGYSPWLSFAKGLKKALGYPIGLVQTALGGTPIFCWHPEMDGFLYRNMINIVRSTGEIKGVLWYQGCSDANPGDREPYLQRFIEMVEAFRRDINNPDAWFLTVQLNKVTYQQDTIGWNMIREAQRVAPKKLSHVLVIPSLDCTLSDFIHNDSASNVRLGERASLVALSGIYGQGTYTVPDIQSIEKYVIGLRMRFANADNGLFFIGEAKDITLSVEDEQGDVEVQNVYCINGEPTVDLRLGRELVGQAYVTMGMGSFPQPNVLLSEHFIPALSFYRFPVAD